MNENAWDSTWFPSREEVEQHQIKAYEERMVDRIIQQSQPKFSGIKRAMEETWDSAHGPFRLTYKQFAELTNMELWMVPRKLRKLRCLAADILHKPEKTEVYKAYQEADLMRPADFLACTVCVVFHWTGYDKFMTFRPVFTVPTTGKGFFASVGSSFFILQSLDDLLKYHFQIERE